MDERSKTNLAGCDERLRHIFFEVDKIIPCTVIEGHRDEEKQTKAYSEGKSKVKWPNSKHNSLPSKAADAMPNPINWKEISRIYVFAGCVIAVASMLGTPVRWGGDWDNDRELKDNSFNDLPHFELIEKGK